MGGTALRFPLVEICIVANRKCSHFATFQVLATGLSALYSDLPTSLDIPSEDWYSLERGLWATFPELVSFLTSLEFCNNVVQVHNSFIESRNSETVGSQLHDTLTGCVRTFSLLWVSFLLAMCFCSLTPPSPLAVGGKYMKWGGKYLHWLGQGDSAWWLPLLGLPWIPACSA